MPDNPITVEQLLEKPDKYIGQKILLNKVTLVSGSVIQYIDTMEDGLQRPSFYCLLELDKESGLVLPFGVKNQYVQEVRPSTYHTLLKASEGKQVSAIGYLSLIRIDVNHLEDAIAEIPEGVDLAHKLGARFSDDAEEIAKGIDKNIRGKLIDLYGLNLEEHYFMEGYIIPAQHLFGPKSPIKLHFF
jgi:hypothetical protein